MQNTAAREAAFLLGDPMSDVIHSAVIEVGVDGSGVDAGIATIERSVANLGRTAGEAGRVASAGINKIGEGGDATATKVDRTTKNLADSIQRATAAMSAGSKGSAEYYAALANSRGANVAALKPYLDQLDAMRSKTTLAADAQRKLDESTNFLDGLKSRVDGIGKTASELAKLRAEQLGVADAAAPMIARMREAEESTGGFGDVLGTASASLASFAAGLAGALTVGAFAASIKGAIDTLADLDDMSQKTGSSVETLSRLQKVAAMVGQEFGPVDAAIVKIAKGMGNFDDESNKVNEALSSLGVSAKDAAGKLRDPSEVMVDASKKLQGYADGAAKTAIINDLLGKSGADLLPYLNDVAENIGKFSGAATKSAAGATQFQNNLGLMRVRASEFMGTVAEGLLPVIVQLSGKLKELADNGTLLAWAKSAATSIEGIASGIGRAADAIGPAIKVTAAYFAVFTGVPAIVTAAAVAKAFLARQIAAVTLAAALGGPAIGSMNTMLYGTSVAANLASKSLSYLALAGSVLFSAFAGAQIGTYLSDQFAEVRIAGLAFVGATLKGWEHVKYGAVMAWEGIGFAWDKTVSTMKASFAGYLSAVASGLSKVGASGTADQINAYAEGLRASAAAQKTFSEQTAGVTAAHRAAVDAIDASIIEMVSYELGLGKVTTAEVAVEKAKNNTAEVTKKNTKAQKETTDAIEQQLAALRLQVATFDMAESAATIYKMGVEGATAAQLKQAKALLSGLDASKEAKKYAEEEVKFYADAAQAKLEAVGASIKGATDEADRNELLARTFGMTKTAIEQLELARLEEQLAQADSTKGYTTEIAKLKELIDAKKRNAAAVGSIDAQTVAKKANEDMVIDWKKTVDKYDDIFRNGFADMVNGGKGAWKSFTTSLVTTFKTSVADQIYKMFAQPFVVKFVASMMGVTGSSAAGVAQAAGGSGSAFGSATSMYSAGKAMYAGFSGGFTTGVGSLAANFGSAVGSSSITAFGSGMAGTTVGMGATVSGSATGIGSVGAAGSTAAASGAASVSWIPIVGWIIAGMATSNALYKRGWDATNGSINNLGKVVGGPILGLNKVLQGLGMNNTMSNMFSGASTHARLFGRKNAAVENFGIEGTLGGAGFAGNAYQNIVEKGGWFRNDKRYGATQGLDTGTSEFFSDTFSAMKGAVKGFGASLGLEASSIDAYTKSIKLALTTDEPKNKEAIAKLFAGIGDEMAAALIPSIAGMAKEGETASATLARLSGSITTANAWLSMLRQRLLQVSLAGGDAASNLADAFGGLENLTNASKAFYQTYYTEGERAARSTEDMTKALAGVNLALPATKDELRNLAAAQDLMTISGRAAYVTLLAIAPEFASVADLTARTAKEAADANAKMIQDAADTAARMVEEATKLAQGMAAKLMATFTGSGLLMPALDAVSLKAISLSSSVGGSLGSSLTATQTRALALATGMSEAQIRAAALAGSVGSLGQAASDGSKLIQAASSGTVSLGSAISALTPILAGAGAGAASASILLLGINPSLLTLGNGASLLSPIFDKTGAAATNAAVLLSDAKLGLVNLGGRLTVFGGDVSGLTSSMTAAGGAAGSISTLFLDAKSGLISFGGGVSTLGPTFTGAQLASLLLRNEIDGLRLGATGARIDIAGLGAALAGVNTETFIITMGLVFDNLAARIKGVIDDIGNERMAVREAALQIINPTVMSKAGIQSGIAGINTNLPGNAGVVSSLGAMNLVATQQATLDRLKAKTIGDYSTLSQAAQNSVNVQQAALNTAKAQATGTYTPVIDNSLALYNQSRSDSLNSLAAFKGLLGTYAKAPSYYNIEENFAAGTKFRAGGYSTTGAQTAQNNDTYGAYSGQFNAAKSALATYTANSNAYTAQLGVIATKQAALTSSANAAYAANASTYAAQMGGIAAQQATITSSANAAADTAKKAQLAYTDALQNFSIDASKSVGKLSRLREETVKYYEAQKQLSDLMSSSAAGLRNTVADYKYNQLSPEQQFNDLQGKYASAYAMALSTDGETLAGYGDKLNSLLNPLLEKAKEVLSDSGYNAFAGNALARADTVAGRLESLTPANYAADSLLMLGQIDATLAALEASSKSAEKIISDAINAGSDKTAAGLRAVIAALTGQAIPGFATGGDFGGGLRIVGENGPELEATGPSRIFNASQTRNMMGGGNMARLEALVERQTQELSNMRAELRAIATSNAKLARMADRDQVDGVLVRTAADTPLVTVAA